MDSRLVAANEALSQGRRADAVDLIIAALQGGVPANAQLYIVLLSNLVRLRRYAEGEVWSATALAQNPKDYALLNLRGVSLRRMSKYREAIKAFDRAMKLRPNDSTAIINKAHTLNDIHDGKSAAFLFQKLVRKDPRNAELHRGLGRALKWQRKFDEAAVRFRQVVTLERANLDGWLDLSATLSDLGDPEGGLDALESGLQANVDAPRLIQAKLQLLRLHGRIDEARSYLDGLAGRCDGQAWYHYEIGRIIAESSHAQANVHYRRALELDPGNVRFIMTYVESLDRTREGDEARNIEESYRALKTALALQTPDVEHVKVVLDVLTRSADHDAIAEIGDFTHLVDIFDRLNRPPSLGMLPRVQSREDRLRLLQSHRNWGDHILERARRSPIERPASSGPRKKIRLGIMSSDLREHPVSYFAWPLFEHADRDRFEIYCYSWFRGEEGPIQREIASMVDGFRWQPFIDSREAAQLIAEDQLDILFELGGTTHMNKFDVMAWKPAALTASWLGYPHSGGISNIDYLLVDPYLNPPDSRLMLEEPLIMPNSWISMSQLAFPETNAIDPVAPVSRNGFVTFGTANNPYKYSKAMLQTWARILARIPDSRFLFVRPEGGGPSFTRNIRAVFEAEGVAGDRILFEPVRGQHMPHYGRIDIALDTFPQTGGTTTCEAAWMGVPTVTLIGEALFERLSYSILTNAGLGDLCARTIDHYVEIAVGLACDVDRIGALRSGLRDQLKASPLCQTEQFAADFYDLVAETVEKRLGAPAARSGA